MFYINTKWKLIISFLVISLIPIILIGIISYREFYTSIEDRISIYSYQLLVKTKDSLDAMLQNIEDTSLQIVMGSDVQAFFEEGGSGSEGEKSLYKNEIEDTFLKIMASRSNIVGITIVSSYNDDIITSGDNAYYRLTQRHAALDDSSNLEWISTINNPMALYPDVVILSRPLISVKTGQKLATLYLSIKEFALAETYSYIDLGISFDLGPSGFMFLMDEDGRIISHNNKNIIAQLAPYSFTDRIISQSEDKPRTFQADLNGEKVLVSYAASIKAGWSLVSVIPYNYLMQPAKEVGVFTLIIGLFIICVAICVSLWISLSISKPVEKIIRAMKRVEKGDLDVNVHFKNKNEIERMGDSFNLMVNNLKVMIKKVYEAEIARKDAEINALQAQINPHFLNNTLMMIDGIAVENGQTKISEVCEKLSGILRYSLNGGEFASIHDEFEQISRYLALQTIRKNQRLSASIQIEPGLENCIVSKMLIQPIVENSIIHGIEKKRGKVFVNVAACSAGEDIRITVADNGIGMCEEKLSALKAQLDEKPKQVFGSRKADFHIGIANVNQRIKLYYGDAYGLEMDSRLNEGTVVTLKIPKRSEV